MKLIYSAGCPSHIQSLRAVVFTRSDIVLHMFTSRPLRSPPAILVPPGRDLDRLPGLSWHSSHLNHIVVQELRLAFQRGGKPLNSSEIVAQNGVLRLTV